MEYEEGERHGAGGKMVPLPLTNLNRLTDRQEVQAAKMPRSFSSSSSGTSGYHRSMQPTVATQEITNKAMIQIPNAEASKRDLLTQIKTTYNVHRFEEDARGCGGCTKISHRINVSLQNMCIG